MGRGDRIAATAVVLYLPALGYGFVVDDHHLMVGNPHVENRTGVLEAFSVGTVVARVATGGVILIALTASILEVRTLLPWWRDDRALADGHDNLGVALAETGDLARARFHFEQAVRLRPDDADFATNLDRARRGLAQTGTGGDGDESGGDASRGASNPPSG